MPENSYLLRFLRSPRSCCCLLYTSKRHPMVEQRIADLTEYAETAPVNRVEMGDTAIGIITSSTSYQYAKEIFGEKASILKLGMAYPMPVRKIKEFAKAVDRLIVLEAVSYTHLECENRNFLLRPWCEWWLRRSSVVFWHNFHTWIGRLF